jgi:hypothetical protein
MPTTGNAPKGWKYHGRYNQDGSCDRVYRGGSAVASLRRRMATGTMMSGGMMGSGSMGGISWMWLPTLLLVVLGAVLFSVIFGKK